MIKSSALLLVLLAFARHVLPPAPPVVSPSPTPEPKRLQRPAAEVLSNLEDAPDEIRAGTEWEVADAAYVTPEILAALARNVASASDPIREGAVWALGRQRHKTYPAPSKDEPGLRLVHYVNPKPYPLDAYAKKIEGVVRIAVLVNVLGDIVHAEVVDGPEELRQAAVDCVKKWTFTAPQRHGRASPSYAMVLVSFRIY